LEYGWKIPQEFKFSNLKEVLEALVDRNPFKYPGGQGFIICDSSFNRIKVMSQQTSSLVFGTDWMGVGGFNFDADLDDKQLKDIIRSNKWRTFIQYFPEWKEETERVLQQYELFCNTIQSKFDELLNKYPNKKDVANVAKNIPNFHPLLFTLWENSYTSTKEYFAIVEEKVFHRIWKKFFDK